MLLTVECADPGCANVAVPVDVDVPTTDDDGNPATWSVVCGPCGAVLASG